MKRNYLALLLALVMITGCIFASVPAVFAAETDTTTEDTTTEDTTTEDTTTEDTTTEDTTIEDTTTEDTTTEEPDEAPKSESKLVTKILIYIIKFFKRLLAYLSL